MMATRLFTVLVQSTERDNIFQGVKMTVPFEFFAAELIDVETLAEC